MCWTDIWDSYKPITHYMYNTTQDKPVEAVYMYITIKIFYKEFLSKDQNLKNTKPIASTK
jgi:hypothetical protein